jgi:tetratricopeptide (TPR) repeat protein
VNAAMVENNYGFNAASAKVYTARVYRYNVKGEKLLDQGKLNEAQQYYQKLLRYNSRNLDARVGLGNVYSAKYQLETAEKEFKRVLKSNPKHPGAHNGMGLTYYRLTTSSNQNIRSQIPDLYNKAISEFKTALRYAPNYPEAHNNLGKIYQEQGQIDLAESSYRQALDLDPGYGDALVNLGSIYYAKGELDAAIDQYQKAIKINSKNSTAHYRLGEAYTAQKKYDQALKSLQTSQYLNPNSAPVHDKLGEVYEQQGNEAAAIAEYKKAILIKPEYSESYLKLANLYEYRGDEEFAITELRSAVNVNPNFVEGKLKIANISTNIGKETQAIKQYQEILQTDPSNSEALKGISQAYYNKAKKDSAGGFISSPGDFVDAEQAVRRALAANPNDLGLHLALLRLSDLAGKQEIAEQELRIIAATEPRTPAQSVMKGEALYTLRRYKEGEQEFLKALQYTTQPRDLIYLGDIFAVNGDLKMAKAAYEKTLTVDPNNLKASKGIDRVNKRADESRQDYRAGKAFFNEGQKVAAIDTLKKASAMNTVDPLTRWLLAESYKKEDFYVDAIKEYAAFIELSSNPDDKLISKAQKNIEKLTKKVDKLKEKGEVVKIYEFYTEQNRLK